MTTHADTSYLMALIKWLMHEHVGFVTLDVPNVDELSMLDRRLSVVTATSGQHDEHITLRLVDHAKSSTSTYIVQDLQGTPEAAEYMKRRSQLNVN